MTNGQEQRSGNEPSFPRLLGERLCLDFANSVENPLEEPEEFLTDIEAVTRWGRHVGLLSDIGVEGSSEAARLHPEQALDQFRRALVLRGGVQRVFLAIAEDRKVDPDDVAIIQEAYLRGLEQSRLVLDGGNASWAWGWNGDTGVELVLWSVAQSAVDLLTRGELTRVKSCGCGWLFYDTSRNGSRRWCSMEGCGSQAKMRRFTEKRRAARMTSLDRGQKDDASWQ